MKILELTELEEFEMKKKQGKVVAYFWADWSGPCKKASNYFENLPKNHPNVHFFKINRDDADDICERYGVENLPAFISFKKGIILDKKNGFTNGNILEKMIENVKK